MFGVLTVAQTRQLHFNLVLASQHGCQLGSLDCSCEASMATTVSAVLRLLEEISNCEFIWRLTSRSKLQASDCTL